MSPEPPEYHTKTLSPLSPLPIYPTEPSDIPVLRNQINPVFNMTSTHVDSSPSSQLLSHIAATAQQPAPQPGSPSTDSSFSDAYGEQDSAEINKEEKHDQDMGPVDDYAMTFESDGEDQKQTQDVPKAAIDPKMNLLPTFTKVPSSIASAVDIVQDSSFGNPQNGSNTSFNPFSSQSAPSATAEPFFDTPSSSRPPVIKLEKVTYPPTYDDAHGGVDIQQLLDNITANSEKIESALAVQSAVSETPSLQALSAHSTLPPRPRDSHARFHQDDKTYLTNTPGLPPAASSYRPPGVTMSIVAAGAPGTSTDPRGGLPPPPTASYSPISRSSQDHLAKTNSIRDEADDLDKRWGPEIQKKYDAFLEDERKNVLEGAWDKFPYGSRLFVGNLASEMVTKRDLYHIFHEYGKIAQVSIKNQYGFVQYYEIHACNEALKHKEGVELRGKKIHLEVSKPQKASNQQRPVGNGGESARGGQNDRNGRQQRNSNDRYDGRPAMPIRHDEYGRQPRNRDEYRQPRRSISPARGNGRGRDSYAPRGRDSYGNSGRESRDRRERSPPPYNGRQNSYRERSPSPVRRVPEPEFQIPHRDPRNIPDVQIIVIEQVNGAFVSWVENELKARGLKTEPMFLNPRISLDTVIQRQVLEGVHAVTLLDMAAQNSSKIPLRVFNRQGGGNNVRFDEYQLLEPKIAAELVLREKQTQVSVQAPYVPPPYSQPQVYQPTAYQPPAATPVAQPNIASLVGSMDNATLQKLLSSLGTAQQQPTPVGANPLDIVGLLGTLNHQPPPQQVYQQPPTYPNYPVNPPAPTYSAPQAPRLPQQSEQSVQNIMAALAAKYR